MDFCVQVLRRSGTDREKKYVNRIEPVLRNTHLLLVTLLLTNAAAMEVRFTLLCAVQKLK